MNVSVATTIDKTHIIHIIHPPKVSRSENILNFTDHIRLIFNSQLLPIKYSDFVFNLLNVCIDNVFYVSASSVDMFFSLFRFNEMGCI